MNSRSQFWYTSTQKLFIVCTNICFSFAWNNSCPSLLHPLYIFPFLSLCVYVYMHVYMLCTFVCKHTCLYIHVHMCTCVFVNVHSTVSFIVHVGTQGTNFWSHFSPFTCGGMVSLISSMLCPVGEQD